MTKRNTKQALLLSVLSLILCVSMLIGSTFAWFTDSVTSESNKIKSGTLNLDLEMLVKNDDGSTSWKSIKEYNDPIFNYDKWEPGYFETKVLKVVNRGTLALKWVAQIVSEHELSALADVIDVYVLPSAASISLPQTREEIIDNYQNVGTLRDFVNTIAQTTHGTLLANDDAEGGADEAYLGIALKMREDAGNIYQGLDLGGLFDIKIFATQLNSEVDSFDKDYDIDSEYDGAGTGSSKIDWNDLPSAYPIDVLNINTEDPDDKIGSAIIPVGAIAPEAEELRVNIVKSDYEANITVDAGQETLAYDVSITGLKKSNDVPVKIEIFIGKDLADTVKLYHYDTEISCVYKPSSGYVIFESATFSPFTIVYDAESEYVAPEVDETGLPVANVVKSTEYENTVLPWGSYGVWSPTEGLDAYLEAAYTFSCVDTPEEAKASPYANWYCDFYVKLDQDLGENEIFLGGNYGAFGWVGFHNGDLILEANTEIPLLGSVTQNPWTYAVVADSVGTFICGVGDVDNALEGATFTVMLRLTNPEDETEFYNVATIEYTFDDTKVVATAEEMMQALANGYSKVVLADDITLDETITVE